MLCASSTGFTSMHPMTPHVNIDDERIIFNCCLFIVKFKSIFKWHLPVHPFYFVSQNIVWHITILHIDLPIVVLSHMIFLLSNSLISTQGLWCTTESCWIIILIGPTKGFSRVKPDQEPGDFFLFCTVCTCETQGRYHRIYTLAVNVTTRGNYFM